MRDRIRPPRDLEHVLDDLRKEGVFQTKQKGMMFAATVGYALDSRHELESTGEGIRLEYFRSPNDAGFIDALAVAHHDSLEVLSEDRREERYDLFEEFAAAGLAEIRRRIEENKSRSEVDIVLDILDDLRQAKGDRVSQLKGLV